MNLEQQNMRVVDEFFEPKFACNYQEWITCPHCGHKHGESWELEPKDYDSSEVTCRDCRKTFFVVVNRSVDYSTKCGEDSDACSFVSQPSPEYPDYMLCERCGNVQFGRFLK